ncbi:hypothetical protein MCOR27_009132 [Pyricularia oryzae]|uniref:Uncharacterized protein n=2 Tax=Pyricularia TaxID=48558 RepID=A0ABQ8NHQ0_PYRGI|nr:hypothetical protein MCOR01_003836 [Pyricularia oryzae]KAI6297159.1 hypothetical protein MCOR33_006448 [Pyricularia grisea]KAH9427360.1 hypothetical protein MCOR02_012266 [Pyricularia oryzae]KAI6255860.1 hypothetical protein MCOR19_007663 [Pyricularia oryzae]KAI6270772.1 hypothetical protein MCOR27_009132 [Pyricularia oryzae]
MASSSGARTPRSVSDATRFTPTTPHAASKAGESSRFQPPSSANAAARPVSSKFKDPRRPPSQSQQPPGGGGMPSPGAHINETAEQRVARLRAQHLAARNAELTFLDKFVDRSRPILDRVHRFTVLGLIGFTAIATVVTAYAAFDMMVYNRKRKSEFIAAQKEMEESSLQAARLAYMRGDATAEQVALVEEAKAKGIDTSFFSNTSTTTATKPPAAVAAAAAQPETPAMDMNQTGWQAVKGFLFGGLKTQDDVVAGKPRSEAAGGIVKTVEDKAKAAFEKEKENQASGGMLDKIGTAAAASQPERAASSIRMSKPNSSSSPAGDAAPATDASAAPSKKGWFW